MVYGLNDRVSGNIPPEGRAGMGPYCFSPTGLSHEMQRKRRGFLNPAASSPTASGTGTGAAGFTFSNFLSRRGILISQGNEYKVYDFAFVLSIHAGFYYSCHTATPF